MVIGYAVDELLLDSVPDSIIIHDLQGNLSYSNHQTCLSLGYSKSELLGMNLSDLSIPSQKHLVKPHIQETISSGDTVFKLIFLRKEGIQVPVEIHARTVKNGSELFIISVIRDIKRREYLLQVTEISERYKAVFDHSSDLVYIHDFKGNFIDANAAALDVLGYTKADIRSLNFASLLDPDQIPAAFHQLERVTSGQNNDEAVEYTIRGRNGQLFEIETKASIISHNGIPYAILGIARDISERKKMLHQLTDERNKLQSFINSVDCGIAIIDPSFNIMYVNENLTRIYGNHVGEKCYKCFEFNDRVCEDCPVRLCMEDGKTHTSERKVSFPDGNVITWENTASPVFGVNGEIVSVVELTRDVTERRKIEEQLRESEESFRLLSENAKDIVYRIHLYPETGFDYISPSVFTVTGYSSEEFKSDSSLGFRIVHPDDREKFNQMVFEHAYDNRPVSFRWIHRNGKVIWVEQINIPIKNGHGKTVSVQGITRDITERKQFEEAIKESEEKYRSLINNIKLGVFRSSIEGKGKFIEVNPAMVAMTGYTREELLSMDIADNYVNSSDRVAFLENVKAHLEGFTQVLDFIKKDKTRITVSLTAMAVKDENGKVVHFDAISEDITERKMMEDRIIELYTRERDQRRELQEEAEARAMFISILAHELRTPLTPMIASIGMLHDLIMSGDNVTLRRLVSNIVNGTETLKNRLDELLSLGRYSRGTFKLNLRTMNIEDLANNVADHFIPALNEKHQYLNMNIAHNLPEIEVDGPSLEQVIMNLLSNASKYSPPASEISFNVSSYYGNLLFEIKDQGIGISLEEQRNLFKPYHRVEQDRQKYPGIGLGLAICKRIVEAHHGEIWIESDRETGSTFKFMIPVNGKVEVK